MFVFAPNKLEMVFGTKLSQTNFFDEKGHMRRLEKNAVKYTHPSKIRRDDLDPVATE